MPEISRRAQGLGTENAFVVLGEVERLRAQGRDIVSFCIGQPDFPTPTHVAMGAIRAICENRTGYTPSPGIAPLRAAVAEHFKKTRAVAVEPDDVVVACGGKPFIGYAILSVTDHGAGHEVVYPNPGFPIYRSMIEAAGAVPVALPLRESRDFGFDLDELAARVGPKTRLLILCSPHNPTGGVLDRATMQGVAALVARWPDLWVYADEVYSALSYDGGFTSLAALPGMRERTIVVDSTSKTYAMTGWRIGYAANPLLAPSFTRWVTNTDSCAPQPNQYAALAALTGPQEATERMRAVFLTRRDRIVAGLNRIDGIRCRAPGGAFYAWPNVTEACRMVGAADSEVLRRRLLEEAGVAVLADQHFGPRIEGEGEHLRFSYASSLEVIDEGLGRLADFIAKHRTKKGKAP